MTRRLLRGAVCAVVLTLLAGCNLASRIVVHPDGSGTYTVLLTVADGGREAGESLYKAVKASAEKSQVPLPVERYSSGSESGAKIAFEFRSLDDLEAEAARLEKVGSGLGGVQVKRDKAGWHFDAASSDGLVRAPGTPLAAPGDPINPSVLGGLVDISVTVELPGAPALNNATAVTHTATTSTFTWALPVGREATPLQASTAFVGDQGKVELSDDLTPVSDGDSGLSGSRLALILVGAAVLVAIGGVAIDRRREG